MLLLCIRFSNHPRGHIIYPDRFHLQLFTLCLFWFQGSGNSRVRPDDKPENERREALQVPKGVLDFSTGSEEDECEFQKKAVDTKRGGNAATEPMSLLQHGFSRLLERVNGKPQLIKEDSCPSIEESSEEDHENQQGKATSNLPSNPDNHIACLKLQRTASHISSSSESENREEERKDKIAVEQSDESLRRRHPVKKWTKKRWIEDEEGEESPSPSKHRHSELSRKVQKSHQAEAYSAESEDLDMEIMTKNKENTSGFNKGNRRRKWEDSNKQRQRVSVKGRWKHSEDIEMFTSSEEEHTPSKKGKPAGCRIASAQAERSRVKKSGASSKSSSGPKCQTSPTSSEKAGTLDSMLGQVRSYGYLGSFYEISVNVFMFVFKGLVQEVKYSHSNQRVVGGSRAEELISRAAERDVFERKMYSQLPANHIIDNAEVQLLLFSCLLK